MSNSFNSFNTSRNSLNTLLLFSYIKLPFPSSSSSSTYLTPLSKNKYNIIRKFFKLKPPRSINSLKSFSIPSIKSKYLLQGKGRSNYLFNLRNIYRFERQIDIILIRSNLVTSIPQARQLIKNGLVYINGKKLSSYYLVQPGDIITLNSHLPLLSHVLPIPNYLIVNPSTSSIIFTSFNFLHLPLSSSFLHHSLLHISS